MSNDDLLWRDALADPGFREALDEGLAGLAEARTRELWQAMTLDPDPLTVYPEPDTDDEPWRVPGPDPDARRWWALAIAAVVLFVVAVAWWR